MADEDASAPKARWRDAKASLALLVRLATFSALACPPGLVVLEVARKAADLYDMYAVDLFQNETAFAFNAHAAAYARDGEESDLAALYNFGIGSAGIVTTVPLMVFMPLTFLLVAKTSACRRCIVAGLVVAGYALWVYLAAIVRVGDDFMIFMVWVPYAALVIGVKLSYPRDSRMWALALLFSAFAVVGSGLVTIITSLPTVETGQRLLMSCLVLPLARELCMVPLRQGARALQLDANIGGSGVVVRRDMFLPMLVSVQTVFATLARVITASVDGPWLALSLISQSVLEISLRLSMETRDRFMGACLRNRHRVAAADGSRRRSFVTADGSVVRSQGFRDEKRVAAAHAEASKHVTAWLVLCEMFSEYLGIVAAVLMTLMGRHLPLVFQLQVFAESETVFEEALPLRQVLSTALAMVAAEFGVDLVCCMYEARERNLPLRSAWFAWSVPSRVLTALLAGAFATSVGAAIMILSPLDTGGCEAVNICYCAADGGLRGGSLLERYCRERLFPAPDGLPSPSGIPYGLQFVVFTMGPHGVDWPTLRIEQELFRSPVARALPFPIVFTASFQEVNGDLATYNRWSNKYLEDRATTLLYFAPDWEGEGAAYDDGVTAGRLCDFSAFLWASTAQGFEQALKGLVNASDCGEADFACVTARAEAMLLADPFGCPTVLPYRT